VEALSRTDASVARLTALVVIVAFEAGEYLQRCVDALEKQTFQDWRAIIWDNCSSDGAVDGLVKSSKFTIVRSEENVGFAAANNRAARMAESEFIVTLNPDAFAQPEWLARLVETATTFGAASVASLQLSADDPLILDGAGDCMSIAGIAWRGGYGHSTTTAPKQPVEIFSACAAAALYRRDVFEQLNGFEESFFCYYEDVDLGFRIRLDGGQCILNPNAIVLHVGSASSRLISGFAEYHGTRNRLWTFIRNMPSALLPIAIPAHLLVTLYIVARSSQKTIRSARIKGLLDGMRQWRRWAAARRRGTSPIATNIFAWTPSALSERRIISNTISQKTENSTVPTYL